MRYSISISIISILLVFCLEATAQDDGPQPITPQLLQKIKIEVEKDVKKFKQTLLPDEYSADQIEFAVDTFRIQRIAEKRFKIDYSTAGMNNSVVEATATYDKLMNKYYSKLLQSLSGKDKQVLIKAQKNWIAYRDAEKELIWTMTKDEYSGGGTIQSMIATGSISDLTSERAIEIFNYYSSNIKVK